MPTDQEKNDTRQRLEATYGQVYDTDAIRTLYTVESFLAPLVFVTRKADGVKGSFEFNHSPRFYFNWMQT